MPMVGDMANGALPLLGFDDRRCECWTSCEQFNHIAVNFKITRDALGPKTNHTGKQGCSTIKRKLRSKRADNIEQGGWLHSQTLIYGFVLARCWSRLACELPADWPPKQVQPVAIAFREPRFSPLRVAPIGPAASGQAFVEEPRCPEQTKWHT